MWHLCILIIFLLCSSFSLKERIPLAKEGDFVVMQQEKNYSLFFIRSLNGKKLLLEEITLPVFKVKNSIPNWKQWVAQKAPGHTAWVIYSLDVTKNQLEECYCVDRQREVSIENENCFLTTLFSLPLSPLDPSQKKRIGPPPQNNEVDRRAFWKPPIIVEGKKVSHPRVTALSAKWPDDKSQLARCELQLYFDAARPHFLFPCWIEVKTPHYSQSIKVIDSGTGILSSPR